MKRVRVVVRGRVQGVSYRVFTKRVAEDYGVLGWVKNLTDGGVEAVLEGQEGGVQAVIEELRRGPAASDVRGVTIEEEPFVGEFQHFVIVRETGGAR